MDFLEWATSPWGKNVPIHIAWFLIWVAAIAGLLFLIVHATISDISPRPGSLRTATHLRSRRAYRSVCPGTR